MRQRINRNAICSSDNYALSKKIHREYLKETHEERASNISMMSITLHYTTIFGKKIYLSPKDAERAKSSGLKVRKAEPM